MHWRRESALTLLAFATLAEGCGRFGFSSTDLQGGALDGTEPIETWEDDAGGPRLGPPLMRDAGSQLDADVPPTLPDPRGSLPPAGDREGGVGPVPDSDAAVGADAGAADAGAASPACDGLPLYDVCWYATAPGQSCLDLCADHGGYDPRSAEHVGIEAQGGSPDRCGQLLLALGFAMPVIVGYRTDGLGFGCHVWDDGSTWWLTDPGFDPGSCASPTRIVCGCQR